MMQSEAEQHNRTMQTQHDEEQAHTEQFECTKYSISPITLVSTSFLRRHGQFKGSPLDPNLCAPIQKEEEEGKKKKRAVDIFFECIALKSL